MPDTTVSAIIACGGSSTRMNGTNKQLCEIGGVPVCVRSMLIFEEIDEVSEILVSAREEDIPRIESLAEEYGVKKFKRAVKGGDTRQQSVFAAFMQTDKATRYIAVHDGARPFADPEKIKKCIADAAVFGGAALGVPVKDTLKTVSGGLVVDTPDRSSLYAVQTPQIFRRDVYVKGVNFALDHELDFTDDCQLAEAVGVKVCITPSDYGNIKITTPEDIFIGEAILRSKK
ncbi:MAG: 2-C-methyl-D-erythritol 4-phosphate cytidylyltransferase [Ruminococcus sp.]|nr:2-C-methyl-D-erythritol 4-phosphate cytidylyltransferase [Ruminococcus sp.]MCM1479823.1 2-C-methyl-D-erythritol 4-phosphate cytidylyltransferase [Muribaculaceae bacterium]